MSVDLRKFEYALEPVRRRGMWLMESLHALLGSVQREIDVEKARLDGLRARHTAQSQTVARATSHQLDPNSYAFLLRWLAQLRQHIQTAERTLAALHERRAKISTQCQAQQRKIDAVDKHREDCVFDFVQQEGARQSTEADRNWLARLQWAKANAPARDGNEPQEPAP